VSNRRLKYLAHVTISNVDKKSSEAEQPVRLCNYTDVYYNESITSELPFMEATASGEQIRRFTLCAGDVLVTKDSETADDIAVPAFVLTDLPGVVCGYHLALLRPRPGVDGRYLFWALKSKLARQQFSAAANGITRFGLRYDAFGEVQIPLWPLEQQRAIAEYIDAQTARIDVLVQKKQRMVELLEERRRALRDHAFDVKPGWGLKRLLAGSMAYGVLVPEFVEPGTGIPMIRTYNLSSKGSVNHDDIAEIPAALASEYRRTSLRDGDLILSVVGSMGRSAVVTSHEQGYNLNRPLARLQPQKDLPSRLLWHWTQTTHFMDMARLATGGDTAQPTLNLGDLANFTVGLPLEDELWPKLLELLEEDCGHLDQIEDQLILQLALLQEHRQVLITAAVVGELQVAGAAA
jgi:type I restriction enzyme, S subunit